MAWQDRPYYRDQTPGRMGPLTWLLSGSVPLFTFAGIRVRLHASMLVLFVLRWCWPSSGGAWACRRR